MKNLIKRIAREEHGSVLTIALILLVVGGLLLAPLLGLMSTGLVSGQVYEKKTDELYAADAGVEDAIWRIINNTAEFGSDGWYFYPAPLIVNEKTVGVRVFREDLDPTCREELRYRIISTAADGSETTVDAYLAVSYLDLANLLDNAIISDNHIGIKNEVIVTGNVTSGGTVDNMGTVSGTITQNTDLDWPSAADLSAYYLDDVKEAVQYDGDKVELDLYGESCPPERIRRTIDKNTVEVSWPNGLGPLKVNGELDITSSPTDDIVTLTLYDTLYITGDTKIFGPNAKEPYRLNINLNGQTIFVLSSTAGAKNALEIKDCRIIGSGAIIAVGDVYFAPKGDVGSEDDFVLVMSVNGKTTLQPSGTFYGCIAGGLVVDVKSGDNAAVTHTAPEGRGLNIPWGADLGKLPPVTGLSMLSWQIE